MLKFSEWLDEDKAYYDNTNFDKKNFPEVDGDYMSYSKASRKALKEIAIKRGIDHTGSKKQLLTKILAKLHGGGKTKGYYNKISNKGFPSVRARNAATGGAE